VSFHSLINVNQFQVNSFKDPSNEFFKIAQKATDFTNLATMLKLIGFFICPRVMATLKIKIFDDETNNFFSYAMKETFKNREKEGVSRHDMIDLLIQAKKGNLHHDTKADENANTAGFATVEEHEIGKSQVKREWDDEDIIAQCFIFFFAGFETVSTTMTFMAYELVRNPEIQRKLQEEIDEVNAELNGEKLSYERLQKMKYLDQVLCETLRINPPAPAMDRMCTKDFTLEYDGKKVEFEAGKFFFLPIYSIHHDERYYPNPETFDPERFSEENKHKINQDHYLPFGIGPRNCIGSRFALMEVKTIFYHLLLNFNFEAYEKTQIPFKLVKNHFAFQIENGLHLALVPRFK
jgi:cytochrome P450 family 9